MNRYKLGQLDRVQQIALSRLQLYTMSLIQERLNDLADWLLSSVRRADGDDGVINQSELVTVISDIDTEFDSFLNDYRRLLQRGREISGSIAFGPYLDRHNHFIKGNLRRTEETEFLPSDSDIENLAAMWIRRRNAALQVASERVFSDRLSLSHRIWRLQSEGMARIRGVLSQGMVERTSAVKLANELEPLLGLNREWPRWARSRLSKMDARQRLNDKTGLFRSSRDVPAGRSRGISYNALRLARNELQHANHAVTTDIAAASPWITGRYVRLSPSHPKVDVCDEAAAGGPYPKGSNFLPLHPQCLCRWEEVLMPPGQFKANTIGWLEGNNTFLDPYLTWLNTKNLFPLPNLASLGGEARELAFAMENWVEGDTDSMAVMFKGDY